MCLNHVTILTILFDFNLQKSPKLLITEIRTQDLPNYNWLK